MSPLPINRSTARRITAPLAALTMAGLLFVYTRTSIRAAKANAQRHREADGGQISWQRETMRRHGVLETPGRDGESKTGSVGEIVGELKQQIRGRDKVKEKSEAQSETNEKLGRTEGDEALEKRGRRGA